MSHPHFCHMSKSEFKKAKKSSLRSVSSEAVARAVCHATLVRSSAALKRPKGLRGLAVVSRFEPAARPSPINRVAAAPTLRLAPVPAWVACQNG